MRLTDDQTRIIRELAQEVAGDRSSVRVFDSRLGDAAHGGDLDLLLEFGCACGKPCAPRRKIVCQSIARHARRAAHRAQPHAPAYPRYRIQGRAVVMIMDPKIALRLQLLAEGREQGVQTGHSFVLKLNATADKLNFRTRAERLGVIAYSGRSKRIQGLTALYRTRTAKQKRQC